MNMKLLSTEIEWVETPFPKLTHIIKWLGIINMKKIDFPDGIPKKILVISKEGVVVQYDQYCPATGEYDYILSMSGIHNHKFALDTKLKFKE